MCRPSSEKKISRNQNSHLFYNDLTTKFHESCSTFICQGAVDTDHNDDDTSNENVPFLNLLPSDFYDSAQDEQDLHLNHPEPSSLSSSSSPSNPWMQNALSVSTEIQQKSQFISQNFVLYTKQYAMLSDSMKMSTGDYHNFEATIVSFMSNTTKRIEQLRHENNNNHQHNNSKRITNTMFHHRNGIIAHLYSELKVIMNMYSKMQSLRNRESLMILDDPLKVSYSCCADGAGPGSGNANMRGDGVIGSTSLSSSSFDSNVDKKKGVKDGLESVPIFQFKNDSHASEFGGDGTNQRMRRKLVHGSELDNFINAYNLHSKKDHTSTTDIQGIDGDNNVDTNEVLIEILKQPLPPLPPKMSKYEKIVQEEELRMRLDDETESLTITRSKVMDEDVEVKETHKTDDILLKDQNYEKKEGEGEGEGQGQEQGQGLISKPTNNTFEAPPYNEYLQSSNTSSKQHQQEELLRQETILLSNRIQNESLDSVQQVETQMIQITSLLNQFTGLINDQVAEIDIIHENTLKSKDNVEKGSEQLLKAKESKSKGRHYFAWAIFILGLLLLFFNAIIP